VNQQYCLDTSFFINSWRKSYPKAVFPGFWKAIEDLVNQEVIFSCDEVFHELQRKEDELYAWSLSQRHIFEAPEDDTIDEMLKVMARFPNFGKTGGSRNEADPWVIAHAVAKKAIVVTDEQRVALQ
jgi:predicted nucleic acid-binding protein